MAGAHLPREGGGSARRESSLVWLVGLSPLADTRTRAKAAVTARGWCYNVALTMGRADRAESMVLMSISAREKKRSDKNLGENRCLFLNTTTSAGAPRPSPV